MSQKPENQFISSVHKHIQHGQPYFEKNNNPYRGGQADVWYSGNKRDMWVEYKWIDSIPKRGWVVPKCSALQLEWLDRHADYERHVMVIVGCKEGGVVYPFWFEWRDGIPAKTFLARLRDRKTIAQYIREETMRA